jgi:hypothetical protein
VIWAVAEEHTQARAKAQFMIVIWTEVGPTCAPEDTKETIIDFLFEQFGDRCRVLDGATWHAINEIARSEDSVIPKT